MRSTERPNLILPRRFLRMCRKCFWRGKVADFSGQQLTGGDLLVQTLVLRRVLERAILASDEKNVAILLPPSIGAVLVNAALPLSGRIPVNLNYTASNDTVKSCLAQVEARHILTSRQFLARTNLSIDANLVFLEDLRKEVTWRDKTVALIQAYLVPLFLLERVFGLSRFSLDDLLTILFTAGSTGEPKGVMLSHGNIGSKCGRRSRIIPDRKDRRPPRRVAVLSCIRIHRNLMDGFDAGAERGLSLQPSRSARKFGELCEEHRVTVILAAPTFLRMYLRRCTAKQLESVNLVVVS